MTLITAITLCLIVLDCGLLCLIMLDCSWSCLIILDYACLNVLDCVCLIMLDRAWLDLIIISVSRFYKCLNNHDRSWLFMIVNDCSWSFMIIHDCSWSCLTCLMQRKIIFLKSYCLMSFRLNLILFICIVSVYSTCFSKI